MGSGAGTSVAYECSEVQGAVLELGDYTRRETLIQTTYLSNYIRRNYASWVSYARRLHEEGGLGLTGFEDSDIVFIGGFTKTTPAWRAIAFDCRRSQHVNTGTGISTGAKLSFTKKPPKPPKPPLALVRQGVAHIQRPEQFSMSETRQQDLPGTEESLRADQTIFIERYKLKRDLFPRILAG